MSSCSKGQTAFDWSQYGDRVRVLNKFREKAEHVDGVLESGDGVAIPVHLVVISGLGEQITDFMYSSDLSSQIVTSSGTKTVKLVKFPDVKSSALKVLVNLAYTGKLENCDAAGIFDVLTAAETFSMKEVISTCCAFLTRYVNGSNCMEMYRVGKRHRHTQLLQASLSGIARNIEFVVPNGFLFQTIGVKDLKSVLCSDELGTTCEEFVWHTIKTWITADIGTRQACVGYLLQPAMRFHRSSTQFLESLISDPLIEAGIKRTRSQLDVQRMLQEKRARRFMIDGRGLPIGLEPESVRPRIPNSVLFACGGWKGGRTTNVMETYDRSTNMWFQLKATLNTGPSLAYYGHQWLNGRIYMFGGTDGRNIKASVMSFDPEKLEWDNHASMSDKRCYVTTSVLNGVVYAIGGHNGVHRLHTVEKYDIAKDEWTAVADMNVARSDASSVVVGGMIYAMGGLNENMIEASVECYDPVMDKWTMVQEMSSNRTSFATAVVNGQIYALGGNRGDTRLASCEKYDPQTNTWAPIANMIDKRSTFSASVVSGKIFIAGGYNGNEPFSRCESYDPATDSWSPMCDLVYARSGAALVQVTGIDNAADYTFHGNCN